MDAILDTSVIIDLFRGDRDLLKKLRRDFVYGISVITLFELYCGSLKGKVRKLEDALDSLTDALNNLEDRITRGIK
jgi:hypothetical protein